MQKKVQGNWELGLFFSWHHQVTNAGTEEKKKTGEWWWGEPDWNLFKRD